MEIKYVTNKFETYVATSTFQLGTSGVQIAVEMEVEFDGTTVIVNGVRHAYPQLRGAVKMGWLVPSGQDTTPQAPVSANIGLRPAVSTHQNTSTPPKKQAAVTVESDERIVMTHSQRKEMTQMKRSTRSRTAAVASPDEGVVVDRRFKTPARSETKLTAESAGAAMAEIQNVKIEPGKGISESEYLAQLDEEDRVKYLSEKESRRSVYDAQLVEKGLSTVVSAVKTAKSVTADGITSTIQTGGGIETADLTGLSSGKVDLSTVSAEGFTFRNTNGPKKSVQSPPVEAESKIVKDGTADARRRIAKAICADFPEDYSFEEHWKRRLARIQLNYSDQPKVIQAIFAAESDDFKKVLLEEFPEAFGG